MHDQCGPCRAQIVLHSAFSGILGPCVSRQTTLWWGGNALSYISCGSDQRGRQMLLSSHCQATTRLIQTPELCHGRIEYTIHQLLGDLATCQARTSSKPVERLYGILDTWKIQISTSLQSSNLSWKGRTSEVDRRMAQRAKSSVWSRKVFIPSRFVVLAITSNSCMGWWSWLRC